MSDVEQRLDEFAKAVAEKRHTRRGIVKVGLGIMGAAVAAALPGRAQADQPNGNDDCAHFCNAIFPPGPARGACKSAAAHGLGICFECGPMAPAGHPDLCVDVCCRPGEVCCNGHCVPACTPPKVLDASTCTCRCPPVECSAPQVVNQDTCVCECPPTTCTAPMVLNPQTCRCECPAGTTTCGDTCCASTELCNAGVCEEIPEPHPECTAATCTTFVPCSSSNPDCVCGAVVNVEGVIVTGICVPGSTPCASLTPCGGPTGFQCGPNEVCAVNSCCVEPVCVPVSLTELCPTVTTPAGLAMTTTAITSGQTFGTR